MGVSILTTIIVVPLMGAVVLAMVPGRSKRLIFAGATLILSLSLMQCLLCFNAFSVSESSFQWVETVSWISSFGITYCVGVDGIGVVMMVLTAVLSLLAFLVSTKVIRERGKEFAIAFLILHSAMLGTFMALDVFFFFLCWEATLIPMYFLIGVYGGSRRTYAAVKFLLYTVGGSVLMLVGIFLVCSFHVEQFGVRSTVLLDLYRLTLPEELQVACFCLFAAAFAITIPIVPLHTWLPDAHVEAPTAGSVLLAGILLKMGVYGFLRFCLPLFPLAIQMLSPYLAGLGVVGILYGAVAAWAQEDIKRLIAYSSISHMGFVVLGVFGLVPQAIVGAVFAMVAHGVSTGTLFLLVGMLYERRHTRMMVDFGGLASVVPRFTFVFFLISLAFIGLPGLCGFVGEFLVLVGSVRSTVLPHPTLYVSGAVLGVILAAAYMLMVLERVFLGGIRFEENRNLRDLRWNEGLVLCVPVILVIWLGIAPNAVLSRITPAVMEIQRISQVHMKAIGGEKP